MNEINYELWQIQPESDCPFVFMGLEWLRKMGYEPGPVWYERVDASVFETNAMVTNPLEYALECIYAHYNPPYRESEIGQPLRSMSVSDVVIVDYGGIVSVWYCEPVGFRRIVGLGWDEATGLRGEVSGDAVATGL